MDINLDKIKYINHESQISEILLLIRIFKEFCDRDSIAMSNYLECVNKLLDLGYNRRLGLNLELPLHLMPVKYLETFNLSIPIEDLQNEIVYVDLDDNSNIFSLERLMSIGFIKKHFNFIFYGLYLIFIASFGLMLKNNALITTVNSIFMTGIILSGYAAYSMTYNLILNEITFINKYLRETEDPKSLFFRIVRSINWVLKRLYEPSISPLGKRIAIQSMAFILLALIGSYFIGISSIRSLIKEDEFLRAILSSVLGILLISNRLVRE